MKTQIKLQITNDMLLYQAVQIATNYTYDDVMACLSALDEKDQMTLRNYLDDLKNNKKINVDNDRIIRAIALIIDKQTANLIFSN